MSKRPELFMVFDVESIGLHGEAFSVGYVVIDGNGREEDSGYYRCQPRHARGTEDDREWVAKNVVPEMESRKIDSRYSDGMGSADPHGVRERFWDKWAYWKGQGAILAADCPWPVEARFLHACIEDDRIARAWQGPYPLIDVASVRLAAGLDPLETANRGDDELPIHHPLADARQSARLLIEAMRARKDSPHD